MFILSCKNLHGALEKTDIMVIGLKEMTFVSALADAVIIEEFIYRTISEYKSIEILETITKYFPLGIGILMFIVSLKATSKKIFISLGIAALILCCRPVYEVKK